MLIEQLITLNIIDENQQVVIMAGDVNDPIRGFTGILRNIPAEHRQLELWTINAMSESRRKNWNLNKDGWIEIWVTEMFTWVFD